MLLLKKIPRPKNKVFMINDNFFVMQMKYCYACNDLGLMHFMWFSHFDGFYDLCT